MENISLLTLQSDDFLNKAFNPCKIDHAYRSNVVLKLNNFLMQYDCRKLGGGKSGATVYLLSNKSENFIFKFSEDAVITSTNNGTKCDKNQKSINEMKREKAKSSCSRTMFGTMLCKNNLSNITIYDSELHYIRAIREIYLMQKYSELQESNGNALITPEIISLGFIGNHTVKEEDMKIYVLEFSISYQKLPDDMAPYGWLNIENETRTKSSSLTIKLKETNNNRKNKLFEMVIGKKDDIDKLILDNEGSLRNNKITKITKKLSESNKRNNRFI